MTDRGVQISEFINSGQMVTAEELMVSFKIGRAAVFRYLKKENTLTSINFRGQYHIKNTALKFNRYGLAESDDKIFSRHGNLLQTIEQLICQSSSGMSISELNRLTGTKTHMQCCNLSRKKVIFRKKIKGQYIYFSAEKEIRENQLKRCLPAKPSFDLNASVESETRESLTEVVKVLVTYLQNPDFNAKSIALSLVRRGNKISMQKVGEIFERYDIAKKNS